MKFVIGLDILQVKKSSITYSINHNFAKIRIDSYNSLRIEKILTFHKVIILSENKNKYYYIFRKRFV